MSTDVNALVIIPPLAITDTMLLTGGSPPATNVPENDYPEWVGGSPAVTYALGDRVILTSTHRIYESLQNGNTDNNPVTSPLWWVEVGPTNRWAALDASVSTQTAQADNITYTFEPGTAINSIAILNITGGTQLNITMTSASAGSPGVVYSKTVELLTYAPVSDWYNWFFNLKIYQLSQFVALDLPSFYDCQIIVEIVGSSDLAVGLIALGQQQRFGRGIKLGARVGIQDYSRKETNEFGETILVQRAFAKRANFELFINKTEVDVLQEYLASIRATPVFWIGSTEYQSTTLFGFYKNFEILLNYPEHADCDLEIEGLT
jgi:hypothetical protein